MNAEILIPLILLAVGLAIGAWVVNNVWRWERLDTPEDIEARERMLDRAERSYWNHFWDKK